VGIAFGDAGCFPTTNGGQQWTDLTRRFQAYETGECPAVKDAAFIERNNGWILLNNLEILTTGEGGKTWKTDNEVNVNSDAKLTD
jgi:photosystem II stability/assembly factor-like uncharacterized protein